MNEEKKRVVAIIDVDKSNSCDVYVLDKRKHFSTVQGKGTEQLPFDVMTNRLTFYKPSEQAVIKENLHAEIEMLRSSLNTLQELIDSLTLERDDIKNQTLNAVRGIIGAEKQSISVEDVKLFKDSLSRANYTISLLNRILTQINKRQ